MDRQQRSTRRLLGGGVRFLIYNAVAILGGIALIRLTPGPAAVAIAAGVACVVTVWIAAHLIDKRWPPHG